MSAGHTLYLLHCGMLFGSGGSNGPWQVPVPAYLIEAASGKRYLVDTGNPAALIGGTDCQHWFHSQCEINPADDPVARLAELGIGPAEIDAIIATHFDFDHAGRYDAFAPFAPDVWVQRAHMAAALSDPDRYDPALWNMSGLRWRSIDGDFEIEPGLRLLRTDGHATGHQSLLIKTDAGWVILAADAIDGAEFLEEGKLPYYYDDADASYCSVKRLLALSADYDAPIIFGHDPEQWATLPHSPAPYRRS
jgi:N-acyl homoserine lactone hydrolase